MITFIYDYFSIEGYLHALSLPTISINVNIIINRVLFYIFVFQSTYRVYILTDNVFIVRITTNRWEGVVQESSEHLMIIKVRQHVLWSSSFIMIIIIMGRDFRALGGY